MRNICLMFSLVFSSLTAFAADQISVTVNGQSYTCSESGTVLMEQAPRVVNTYCECNEISFRMHFQRFAVMSNGTIKSLSSTPLTPLGSSNPDDIRKDCQLRLTQCK